MKYFEFIDLQTSDKKIDYILCHITTRALSLEIA